MQVYYLEFVTPDVEAMCTVFAGQHGVNFAPPEPSFGNARIAETAGGGRLGVRPPMRADEAPTVRPYMRVEDIDAALAVAEDAGAMIAMAATEMPGHGKFAIYILGDIQHGLWQL